MPEKANNQPLCADEIKDNTHVLHWRQSRKKGQHFTMPSMVEPVHNLSLEEIMNDYSRGIVHTFKRTPLYDEGDDVEDVNKIQDFTDLEDFARSPELADDAGKQSETDDNDENERSEAEEAEEVKD